MSDQEGYEGHDRELDGFMKTRIDLEEEEHCQPLPDYDPYEYDFEIMTAEEMADYEKQAEQYEQAGRQKRGATQAKSQSMWGPRKKAIQGRKTYATGPKGVLTDFEEHKLQEKAKDLTRGFQKLRTYKELGRGKKHYGEMAQQQEEPVRKGRRPRTSDDEDEDSSDDFSDEDLLLAFKQEKLLIANADRPTFRKMRELNYLNFDKEVDGEDPNVYILVLFYQDYLVECSLLESILRNLAPYYPYLKFMRARTDQICPDLEDSALPALVVFQDKKQVWREVAVTKFLPPQFGDDDVVKLLNDANVLQQGLEYKVPTKQEFADAYNGAKNASTRHNDSVLGGDPGEDSDSFDI